MQRRGLEAGEVRVVPEHDDGRLWRANVLQSIHCLHKRHLGDAADPCDPFTVAESEEPAREEWELWR